KQVPWADAAGLSIMQEVPLLPAVFAAAEMLAKKSARAEENGQDLDGWGYLDRSLVILSQVAPLWMTAGPKSWSISGWGRGPGLAAAEEAALTREMQANFDAAMARKVAMEAAARPNSGAANLLRNPAFLRRALGGAECAGTAA